MIPLTEVEDSHELKGTSESWSMPESGSPKKDSGPTERRRRNVPGGHPLRISVIADTGANMHLTCGEAADAEKATSLRYVSRHRDGLYKGTDATRGEHLRIVRALHLGTSTFFPAA